MNIPDFSSYMKTAASPANTSFVDAISGFVEAVHWTEPFIIGLLASHLLFAALAVLTRKYTTFQTILWLLLLLAAWLAKHLNNIGGKYWKEFATQDYFDKNGFFISMMYSLPIMCICLYIVGNFVFVASKLLIEVKRAEFRRKMQNDAKKD